MNYHVDETANEIITKYITILSKKYNISLSDLNNIWFDTDKYNKNVLQIHWNIHKKYVNDTINLNTSFGLKIRLPNIPETISQNIIKYILHKEGDMTCSSECKTGDLISCIVGKIECKCFTSDGPISFGPTENWNEIYFLDMRNWLKDEIKLYKVSIDNKCEKWKNLQISKSETYYDQCKQKRRPRIGWKSLQPQITDNCKLIFDGSINEL